MNKKVMYGIIGVIVIAVIAVGVWFAFFNKKKVEIDLAALNQKIETTGHYNEMSMMTIDKAILSSLMEIPENEVEEVIGGMPMMNIQASMYIVIKATPGNVENVKQKLEAYGKAQEATWERYLPAQYEIVKNRKVGTIGDYAYLVIAENADDVVAVIK